MPDTTTTSRTTCSIPQTEGNPYSLAHVDTATSSYQQPIPKAQLRTITKLNNLQVLDDINVVVEAVDEDRDNFLASFDKANVVASGDTPDEAMHNLCESLELTFEFLVENEGSLGREPKRQLAVLREHLGQ